MWIYLKCENYLLKHNSTQDTIIFYLTDMVDIWSSECSHQAIIECFRGLNPLFEMTDQAIIDKVIKLYSATTSALHNISKNDHFVKLTSKDTINRFSYKMEFEFYPKPHDILYKEFYKHIFDLMNDMHRRESLLVDIIKAKDAEIEEYRLEGVEIKRRAAITTPFNYQEFQEAQTDAESLAYPSSLFQGPLGESLGRRVANVKVEEKEEKAEESINKTVKGHKSKRFDSRGCLYKKDDNDSRKKLRKSLKL